MPVLCAVFCRRLAVTVSFYKVDEVEYTGNPFRSSVLGVMSPARSRCAMPVLCVLCVVAPFYVQLDIRELRSQGTAFRPEPLLI